jgi:hypothetical protein
MMFFLKGEEAGSFLAGLRGFAECKVNTELDRVTLVTLEKVCELLGVLRELFTFRKVVERRTYLFQELNNLSLSRK